jgi:choline dehydrogenase-like flavoprotein
LLINARDLQPDHVLHSDICIVGAGPAGLTLAREFARAHIDFCLIESGGLEQHAPTQSLAAGENNGLPYFPLHKARARYFGGSSNLWFPEPGLRSRPLDSSDFAKRSWISHSGWPISKADLAPYYEEAQQVCGLGPYSYDVLSWEDAESTPRLALDETRLRTRMFQFARTDTFKGYLDELARSSRSNIVLNATVVNIETSEDAPMVRRLRVQTLDGKVFEATAKVYILAAGGIENARLLLLSRSRHSAGLGNQNDLVGRFFAEHIHLHSSYLVPSANCPPLDLYVPHLKHGIKVAGALAISRDVQEREGLGNLSVFLEPTALLGVSSRAIRSFRQLWLLVRREIWSRAALNDVSGHIQNILRRPNDVAKFALYRVAQKQGPRAVQFMLMSEQVPNPDSRITLSPRKDRLGLNKVRLEWRISGQDIRTINVSERLLDDGLQRAGVGRLEAKYEDEMPRPALAGGWHHMGTTRMHQDERHGVVDPNCKVHGLENLFVAGSSVFPTQGYANPTLTIVALAIRLARHVGEATTNATKVQI